MRCYAQEIILFPSSPLFLTVESYDILLKRCTENLINLKINLRNAHDILLVIKIFLNIVEHVHVHNISIFENGYTLFFS